MLQENVKNLRTEDFLVPNKVLCYGGGAAFDSVAPYMFDCQINIVGIIDTYKKGFKKMGEKSLRYYSPDEAMETFGKNVIIIITIADATIISDVKKNLVWQGFNKDRIFDFNIWTYLMIPSEKSYCRYLCGEVQFLHYALSACCVGGMRANYFCEWFLAGRSLEESFENFMEKRAYYFDQSQKGRIPLYCKDCRFLSKYTDTENGKIHQFFISDPAGCNADCVYCWEGCSESPNQGSIAVEKRYRAIVAALDRLRLENMLDVHAIIRLAGGETTINPFKHLLYEAVRLALEWSPELEIQILSNCFIYDSEISEIISHNSQSYLQCDLDAGTPESYINVKGFNKFYTVKENLKKYAQYGKVQIKYIILPGWNDSDADYQGTVEILKDLGLKELLLGPEFSMSRENNKKEIRQMLFASARFMAVLEKNGIKTVLPDALWKKEYVNIAKRLLHELQTCRLDCGEAGLYPQSP